MALIIIASWLLLTMFNIFKINQSSQGADMFEKSFAIVLAPVYTVLAIIVIFIIKPWN